MKRFLCFLAGLAVFVPLVAFAQTAETPQIRLITSPVSKDNKVTLYPGESVTFYPDFVGISSSAISSFAWSYDANALDCPAVAPGVWYRKCTVSKASYSTVTAILVDSTQRKYTSNPIVVSAQEVRPTIVIGSNPVATNGNLTIGLGEEVVFTTPIPANYVLYSNNYDRDMLNCSSNAGAAGSSMQTSLRCTGKKVGSMNVSTTIKDDVHSSVTYSNIIRVSVVDKGTTMMVQQKPSTFVDDLEEDTDSTVEPAFNPLELSVVSKLFQLRSNRNTKVLKFNTVFEYYANNGDYYFDDRAGGPAVVGELRCVIGGQNNPYVVSTQLLYEGAVPVRTGDKIKITGYLKMPSSQTSRVNLSEESTCTLSSIVGGYNKIVSVLKRNGRKFELHGVNSNVSYLQISNEYADPNPYNADNTSTAVHFTLNKPARVSVWITTASGAVIRTLTSNNDFAAGARSFVWDGHNDQGSKMPEGLYRFLIRASSSSDGNDTDFFSGHFRMNRN